MGQAGRPLYSRRVFGYGGDVAALHRLKRAALEDTRMTTRRYATICDAIRRIERTLALFKTRTR